MNYDGIIREFLDGETDKRGASHYLQRLFISGGVLYSYGVHFPLASFYDGVLLVNPSSYSNTTAGHKSRLLRACKQRGLKVVNIAYAGAIMTGQKSNLSLDAIKKQISINDNAIKKEKDKLTRARAIHRIDEIKNEILTIGNQNEILNEFIPSSVLKKI